LELTFFERTEKKKKKEEEEKRERKWLPNGAMDLQAAKWKST
jgi:hypothetical protein